MRNPALLIILAAAGLAAYFAFTSQERLVPGQGWVATLAGRVFLMRPDGSRAAAQRNAIVKAGDSLFTEVSSHCTLKFEDGSTAALGPSTKLSVLQLHKDPMSSRFVSRLKLHAGKVQMRAAGSGEAGSSAEVRTVSSTLNGSGAEFVIAVGPEGTTRAAVYRGAVRLEAQGKTMSLSHGQAVLVGANEAPTAGVDMIDAPIMTRPEPEDRVKTATIGVEYLEVKHARQYLVELARNPKFTYIVAEAYASGTTVDLPGPSTDGPYYLRASAVDNAGLLGKRSDVVTLFYEHHTAGP